MVIIQVNCIICLKLYPEEGQTVLLSSGGITVFMHGCFFFAGSPLLCRDASNVRPNWTYIKTWMMMNTKCKRQQVLLNTASVFYAWNEPHQSVLH